MLEEKFKNSWACQNSQRAVAPREDLSSTWCYHQNIYLTTPWSRALLEKLTDSQLVKKFSATYGTRIFIAALTSARHLSLSWASPTQSMPPHPTSWRSNFILSSHLRLGLPSGLFPLRFPHQNRVYASPLPHTFYISHPSHVSRQVRCTTLCFVTWDVFTVRSCYHLAQNLKLDDHPLLTVRICLFNIFAASLHIGGRSSIRNLRTCHAVVTATHGLTTRIDAKMYIYYIDRGVLGLKQLTTGY